MEQMRAGDSVVAYLELFEKSGCLKKTNLHRGFIAVTEQRLIVEGVSDIEATGLFGGKKKLAAEIETVNVPLSKVSSISTTHVVSGKTGCLGKIASIYYINVNIQGLEYSFFAGSKDTTIKEFIRSYLDRCE